MSAQSNIYRHVVFFKFHDRTGTETVDAIVDAFRALCAGLPFVKSFEWGQNSSPENLDEGYTHCFIVTFGSAKDRDAYLPHPAHQAFCKTHLDPNLEKVCVIDYILNN
ncbi:MAG TPA: Dabb family protein [Verrucomicrobiae bacterium]|nr:Dabb family protein [Verrucomicrobiae bacterium]